MTNTNSKKIFVGITDDKDLIRKTIFDGTEEKAIELCKELCKEDYNLYDSWSGFGLYLTHARRGNPEKMEQINERLSQILDGQKEETHHVWIVLQEVMKFMAGQATSEFKKKVLGEGYEE